MRMPAIDDHVTTALHAWYTEVAIWSPPGEFTTGICADCRASALAQAVDIEVWPHDIIHRFVTMLAAVQRDVSESYREEQEERMLVPESGEALRFRLGANAGLGRRAVAALIARHSRDIVDVLEQCISERMLDYVSAQAEGTEPEHAFRYGLRAQ